MGSFFVVCRKGAFFSLRNDTGRKIDMALIYIVEDDKNIREIESFALKNAG